MSGDARKIIQALKQAGTANPVMLLDEVYKISIFVAIRRRPLEVLDPSRTAALPIITSKCRSTFPTSSSSLPQTVGRDPAPLRDRMEIIQPLATRKRKARYRQAPSGTSKWRCTAWPTSTWLSDNALRQMIARYTREAGVSVEAPSPFVAKFPEVVEAGRPGTGTQRREIPGARTSSRG